MGRVKLVVTIVWLTLFIKPNNAISSSVNDSLLAILPKTKSTLKCEVLNQLAANYKYSDTVLALKYANEALNLSEKLNYAKGQANANITIGIITKNNSNYALARTYFIKGLSFALNSKDLLTIALANHSLGNLSYIEGDYSVALRYYLSSLNQSEQIKDYPRVFKTLNNIAAVYYEIDNFEKSEEYYNKALKKYRAYSDKLTIAQLESNLGNVYQNQEKYDDALNIYKKALLVFNNLNNVKSASSALNNIGFIYMQQDKLNLALPYFIQSLKIDVQLHNYRSIATSCINLCNIYTKFEKLDSALYYGNYAIAVSEKNNLQAELADAYRAIALTYNAKGNTNKFNSYYSKFENIQKVLVGNEKQQEILSLQAKYEAKKKELELKLLEKDVQLKESKILEQHNQLTQKTVIMWLGGSVLIIAAINVTLYIYFLIIKRRIKELNNFTDIISFNGDN